MTQQLLFIAVIAATLTYAFLNGLHDSSGLVAAAISSRSITPRFALTLASFAEFAGPFLFGTAVAATIGKDLVDPSAVTLPTLFVAVASAVVWNLVTWYFGLPSSSTHALLGGIIGAVSVAHGYQALELAGFAKVLFALFVSPIIGLVAGYAFMQWTLRLTRRATPHINTYFKRVQLLNVIALALSHGTNDGQKSMGLIAMALVAAKIQGDFSVPPWVTLLCAIALTLGVNSAGWRIMKTLGGRIYRLRPVHAFAAQTASAAVILGAALLGAPVSTTQAVSASIMGVGSAERLSGVRWEVAGQMVAAWLLTIPASALLAALLQIIVIRLGL
ncbi:MAG: inorganic phosphate transporter [Chloroflexota bacterium]|nr:inorganic phosphate transporter [Chloroflexota bacterium]